MNEHPFRPHSSHWGTFHARHTADGLEIRPFEGDPDPSPILANIPAALTHPARLTQPLIRRGWLERGPGPDKMRGHEDFVAVPWDEALDIAAAEMKRLGAGPGLPAEVPGRHVFGGSYGWSSAGRFHHAQSQVHRFLNIAFGGYVASVDTYSSAAGSVILSMTWGHPISMMMEQPFWTEIAEDTELLIAFGGIPVRNLAVSPGGNSQHVARPSLKAAAARGCKFVSVSPLADDMDELPGLTRIAPRPGTDVALMLGLAHTLATEGLADRAYLDRYTTGYDRFLAYLTGESDGTAKTPDWASAITGVPAGEIRALARQAAGSRTHVSVAYALQRARNGEQPVWAAMALAAMLGQSAEPGGGFSYGLASIGNVGKRKLAVPLPTLPQGENRSGDFIPVARIAELLQNPGKCYTYKGETREYADIRLVYWAGGNPFHHHQHLGNMREAFACPDTVIVHDSVGTASARHADIVFPVTVTPERADIGASANDPFLIPMPQLAASLAGPRHDYDVFSALSERLGCADGFTEGRNAGEWQEWMYERTRAALAERQLPAPDFAAFMDGGILELPVSDAPTRLSRFHADPEANPLDTPSGKMELFCDAVEAAGLPGHPAWLPPEEWLGADLAAEHPFQLVANQPRGKLHSQLDFGAASMATKRGGREVARMNPDDAQRLGIGDGDVIRIWNGRGGLLAVAAPADGVREGIVQLSTGGWYAPVELPEVGLTCVNGNPNAVSSDIGASLLSQGCAGQLSLVSVTRWEGEVPSVVPQEAILPRP
ncbi:molybdopterin-dependent oxidoreductase [Mangrovicoccus sp. HB161399]|uniref:molybdopterin-dependent oxidoreductase n=1 Tax=Mangrovicoccus sp. HB161399 TaxID=2720392 RepID=UPI001553CEA2|nr:molybdopterin-dependent oxidoreductase [Mangrovicoccus sp. HB161399]